MKFTNFFLIFLAYWVRIHNTASLVAVVMNRNVDYIRKVFYIVVAPLYRVIKFYHEDPDPVRIRI